MLARLSQVGKKFIVPDSLTESGGIITLMFNGQTYTVSPSYTAHNQLTYLYFVPSQGVIESINPNSIGPVGYSSWILVGAFYTNGLNPIGFGSFVSIEGEPTTDFWDAGTTEVYNVFGAVDGAVSTAAATDRWLMNRQGKFLTYHWDYYTTSAVGASAGTSGTYVFWAKNFSGITMDTNYATYSSTFGVATTLYAFLIKNNTGATTDNTYGWYARNFGVSLIESGFAVDAGHHPLNSFSSQYSIKIRDKMPITQWDTTPLWKL